MLRGMGLCLGGLLLFAIACGPSAPPAQRTTPAARQAPPPPPSPFLRAYPDFRLAPRCLRYVRAYSCYLRALPLHERRRAGVAYRKLLQAWAAGLAHAHKEPPMWKAIRQVCTDALAGFDKAVGKSPDGRRCLATAPAPALLPGELPPPPRGFVGRFLADHPEFRQLPECVGYLRAYLCFVTKLPDSARVPVQAALAKTVQAWHKAIVASQGNPSALQAIRKGCGMALQAFVRALANHPTAKECLPAPAP